MTDQIDDQETNGQEIRRRQKGEGEGEQAGRGIAKMLTTRKAEQVTGERRHLTGADLIEAIVEFVSEPLIASASAVVEFVKGVKNAVANPKSFAVTNWFTDLQKHVDDLRLQLARARGADANGLAQKRQPGHGLAPKLNLTPTGPTGAQ